MTANLGNSAVTTGLEKVSFHSNPKERQCQRMLKLPHIFKIYTCVNYYLNYTRNLITEMDFKKIKLVTEVTIVL